MDKNTLTGFILIGAILAGFWFLNKPTEQQMAEQRRLQDSLALVQQKRIFEENAKAVNGKLSISSPSEIDSAEKSSELVQRFGDLAAFAVGEEKFYTLENDKMVLKISNKGARIASVMLKEYLTSTYEPLYLFKGDESHFEFNFFTDANREISTGMMFFETNAVSVSDASKSAKEVSFSLTPAEGKTLEISYSLEPGSYTPNITIDGKKLQNLLPRTNNTIYLNWDLHMPQVEKGVDFEKRYSGLYWKHYEDAVEDISGGKADEKSFATRMKWVGFKDQFFSSVLIADKFFTSTNVAQTETQDSGYLANMKAELAIPVTNEDIVMKMYFGPNHYRTLKKTGYDMQKLIHLGWPPVKYVNQWIVIPVFNILSKGISNYGIIILVLTIFIKLLIFPFTYKSYISTAKMRVLKPQIDEATKKFGSDKQMEKQQATMAIYKKAGVNPMGGCLPMVFQFPILVAMFYFFPSSIELRQESFLWAKDLASYDAIITWKGSLPLVGDLLGNHISLFTLLMSITNIFYTMINQEMTASTQQMKGMKTMMYLMPIMFFFMFNKYAAGLSYYYFISTLITIGQTFLMRRFVNEEQLLAKLEANKKKPAKKSKFAARLEQIQKQQQLGAREQAKRNKR